MLLLTTVAALVMAGFARQGFEGALGAVTLSWMVVIGTLALLHGLGRPRRSWTLLLGGICLTAFGLYGWLFLLQTQEPSVMTELDPFAENLLQLEPWRNLLIVCAFVFVIWRLTRPTWQVTIVVDTHRIKHLQGIAESKRQSVSNFLESDVTMSGPVAIRATRERDGYLRVHVKGNVPPDMKQQIRNFLNTVM